MNLSYFKQRSAGLLVAAVLSFTSAQAMATQIFTFTFSGANTSGSGQLVATDNGDGTFTALSGSATDTVNGVTDTLNLFLNPNGTTLTYSPSGFFIFDNQLYPDSNPLIANGGLLFTSSTQEVNLFSNGVDSYLYYQQDGFNEPIAFTLTAAESAAVPEPASIALFGLGIAGIGVLRRRKAS
jgi:PEP-CTERM motif